VVLGSIPMFKPEDRQVQYRQSSRNVDAVGKFVVASDKVRSLDR
jgi:hypothetical protein